MGVAARALEVAQLEQMLRLRDDWALFDVREPVEAERGHIPGATSLPRRRIELRIEALVRDRATPIVLVDDDSGRASLAAQTLIALGYRKTTWLQGGIAAWQAAGHKLATGNNVPSKLFGEHAYHDFSIPDITADTLAAWQREGRDVRLFDVRTPEEYAEACIPGATSGPSFDIARHAGDLQQHDAPVVVHCAGRTRSLIAAQTLRELGVTQAVALRNGTMGWHLAGLQVERGGTRALGTPSAASLAQGIHGSLQLAEAAGVGVVDATMLAIWLRQADNLYVFDVRQVEAYVAGHIPGAQAVPGGQVVQRADDFIAVRGARIVLVDDDGTRARLTAVWLRRMGFPNVLVLSGGIAAWRAAGGVLESGRMRRAPAGWVAARAGVRLVTAQDVEAQISHQPGLVILDVDTSAHFRRGHVPGAQWMPRGWLELRIAGLVPDLTTPLLVTCATGVQGVYAAGALSALGYRAVTVLDGGTASWRRAGYRLEAAELPPQDDILLPPYVRGEQAMRDYLAWETDLVRE